VAGPRLEPATDLRNSEGNAARIMYHEPCVHTGQHPIVLKVWAAGRHRSSARELPD